LKKQWRGTYFNRAYVATTQSAAMNEVGGQTFWLEPNAFALLNNDLLTPAQLDALVTAMKTQLSDPSPNGMAITAPNVEPVFVRELTVSSWHSINGTAIQGLLQQSGVSAKAAPLAWTEFKKNTLAVHAELYPNLWYGIWTGPDSYFNETHRYNMESWQKPGGTWMEGRNMIVLNSNFPAGNPHTHSQPLLNTIRFAGIEADALGFRVIPQFPFPNFSWNTPTHSVTYTAKQARGTFKVATQQPFRVTVLLPTELQGQSAITVKMNGTQSTLPVTGKTIQFTATPDTTRGVVWSVE